MGDLLILLFIFFVVIPLVRLGWFVYKANRNARRMFRSFGEQTRRESGYRTQPRDPAPRTQPRAKKISRDVGEYINFEELPPQTDRCDLPPRGFTVEEQIVDVEWEDIKS